MGIPPVDPTIEVSIGTYQNFCVNPPDQKALPIQQRYTD